MGSQIFDYIVYSMWNYSFRILFIVFFWGGQLYSITRALENDTSFLWIIWYTYEIDKRYFQRKSYITEQEHTRGYFFKLTPSVAKNHKTSKSEFSHEKSNVKQLECELSMRNLCDYTVRGVLAGLDLFYKFFY